jgi:hypothetical protein
MNSASGLVEAECNLCQRGKLEAVFHTVCLKRNWLAGIRATTISLNSDNHTANEGPVRIQYKCLVSITEMKLLFPKQNYDVLSPSSYPHIPVRDLYISRIGLPILLQENMYVDRSWEYINRLHTHECGIWTEAAQFPEKDI